MGTEILRALVQERFVWLQFSFLRQVNEVSDSEALKLSDLGIAAFIILVSRIFASIDILRYFVTVFYRASVVDPPLELIHNAEQVVRQIMFKTFHQRITGGTIFPPFPYP